MEAQQHQQYDYQYQTQNDTTAASQSYDPSQIQAYDQSTQAYYAYQQQQQQPDYSSYYYPDYSNSYQTQPQTDPNSVQPPGVTISTDTSSVTNFQNPQNLYYPPAVVTPQPQPTQAYMPPSQFAYRGRGGRAGRFARGGGRGTFGRRGRGRGGARGKHVPPQTTVSSAPAQTTASSAPATAPADGAATLASSSVQGNAAQVKPPTRMAWCEICRVDCTTAEILEVHKNGKKHKKNLKVFEELQNLSKQLIVQNPEIPPSQPNSENGQSEKPESENIVSEPMRSVLKRNMRGGGRGGKWMRASDGSRRPVEPPKPKLAAPLLCDLCNVKCESQVVFESHIAGKKHLLNVKRLESHKEAFGGNIQDLYPTIPNVPSISIIPQQGGPQDAEALASLMINQLNLPDPQATQKALAELLNQHGVHDAQTLLAQLVPYLLAQAQVPGSVGGLGTDIQNSLRQGVNFSTGVESQNLVAEEKSEEKNAVINGEPKAGEETNEKAGDGGSLQSQCEGSLGNDNVVPAKEEATVSEHDKQSN